MAEGSLKRRYLRNIGAIALGAAVTAIASTAMSAPLLYDVNDTATNNTQAGWTAVNLNNINGVTFTPVGGAGFIIDDRDRGAANTDGPGGDVANNNMWRDFIFGDHRGGAGSGMDITISGLSSNTSYSVRLWAFDDVTNHNPNMTWNGTPLTFPVSPDPTSLSDYVASFSATSDGSGNLVLQGRSAAPLSTCCEAFVNGFELTAVPEPGTLAILGLGLVGLGVMRRKRVT